MWNAPYFVLKSAVFCGMCCSASWWIMDPHRTSLFNEWQVLYLDYMNVTALCVFWNLFIYWVSVLLLLPLFILWNFWIWHGNGMTAVKTMNNKVNITNICIQCSHLFLQWMQSTEVTHKTVVIWVEVIH